MLIVDIEGVIAPLVVNVQAGAAAKAWLKVIVQAVAAVMPLICPLWSVDPVTIEPPPHEDITGALPVNVISPLKFAA